MYSITWYPPDDGADTEAEITLMRAIDFCTCEECDGGSHFVWVSAKYLPADLLQTMEDHLDEHRIYDLDRLDLALTEMWVDHRMGATG